MEIQILHWFESLHNPVLNPIMYGITTLGDKGLFWILMALMCLTILPKKYRKVGFTMAVALIFSVILIPFYVHYQGDIYFHLFSATE